MLVSETSELHPSEASALYMWPRPRWRLCMHLIRCELHALSANDGAQTGTLMGRRAVVRVTNVTETVLRRTTVLVHKVRTAEMASATPAGEFSEPQNSSSHSALASKSRSMKPAERLRKLMSTTLSYVQLLRTARGKSVAGAASARRTAGNSDRRPPHHRLHTARSELPRRQKAQPKHLALLPQHGRACSARHGLAERRAEMSAAKMSGCEG